MTFDRLRSPLLREIDSAYVEAVKRGVAFMDAKYGPDWAQDHSDEFLTEFRISSANSCILGIMGREEADEVNNNGDCDDETGYSLLCEKLGIDGTDHEYGFSIDRRSGLNDWKILQRTWEIALRDLIEA